MPLHAQLRASGDMLRGSVCINCCGEQCQPCLQLLGIISLCWGCRSGEWGTQPAWWYFSSALPRALLGALPLAAVGSYLEARTRPLLATALAFAGLYSFLPHKEVPLVLSQIQPSSAAGLRMVLLARPLWQLWAAVCCL